MADGSFRARIDPSLLDMFLAVADAGRISVAARALTRSQPAITAQLHRLEADVGAPLFVRSVRGVALTEAGERLLGYARRVRVLLDEAAVELDPARAPAGELRLGASTTIAAYVLPPVLAAFRRAHPRVPIRVEVANTERITARLGSGALPLGLVEGHARASQLRLEPFVDDELVLTVAAHSPFRVRSAEDLSTVPMVWREPGSGTRAVIERALRGASVRREARSDDVELGSNEAIASAVAAGLGVAFLSRWSLAGEPARGALRVVPLDDLKVRRAFRWALPPGGLVGTARSFYDFARRRPPRLRAAL